MTDRRLSSWSISLAQIFEQCAYRVKLARIDRIPDLQPRLAADRGTLIHSEAEHYVDGTGPFTHSLRHFADDFAALKRRYDEGLVVLEEEWGFSADWAIVEWAGAWLRLKCDAVCFLVPSHAAVVDFKSGKRWGNEVKHAIQLQLYALATLLRYPEVDRVTTELWYLDCNELARFTMTRKQISRFLRIFDELGKRITNETAFLPNPNIFSCAYCPYHPEKQADCRFGAPLVKPGEKIAPKPITFDGVIAPTPFDAELFAEAAALQALDATLETVIGRKRKKA